MTDWKLLVPLGLLGLIGILILIIIYIIKPNYQQKFVSSTFVWKLSLKYRKRKVPINKLRNLLIIICQILILALCSFILSQPVDVYRTEDNRKEVVLVIDSSASMRTVDEDGQSRFARAIIAAKAKCTEIFENDDDEEGSVVSIVLANDTPSYLMSSTGDTFRQINSSKAYSLYTTLDYLRNDDTCSYSVSDMKAAMDICQQVIDENPEAEVFLYTDTSYASTDTVTVVNVNNEGEWNIGILNAQFEEDDYYYRFLVDVGYYAKSEKATQTMKIGLRFKNANAADKESEGVDLTLVTEDILFNSGEEWRLIFKHSTKENHELDEDEIECNVDVMQRGDREKHTVDGLIYYYVNLDELLASSGVQGVTSATRLHTFENIDVFVDFEDSGESGDSYALDDNFIIYGGIKEIIRIQYYSSHPNDFMMAPFKSLQNIYSDRWDIRITEIKKGTKIEDVPLSGFDFYVFEHTMPNALPTDGAVMLVNPDKAGTGWGYRVDRTSVFDTSSSETLDQKEVFLEVPENEKAAAVIKGIDFEEYESKLLLTKMCGLGAYDTFDVLMTCEGWPAFMVKNDGADKMAVMSFNIEYSTFPLIEAWPYLMINLFDYFFPSVMRTYSYAVDSLVTMESMSESLLIEYPNDTSADGGYNPEDGANTVRDVGSLEWEADTTGEGNTPEDQIAEAQMIVKDSTVVLKVELPGRYIVTQTTYYDRVMTEGFFVSVAASEGNIWCGGDLDAPIAEHQDKEYYGDWLLVLAAILVGLLFIEWWLHSREGSV